MTDPIKNLIAAAKSMVAQIDGSLWLEHDTGFLHSLANNQRLHELRQAIAAAEARPEPAAEPSEVMSYSEAMDGVQEATRLMVQRATGREFDSSVMDAVLYMRDAVEALAREVRRENSHAPTFKLYEIEPYDTRTHRRTEATPQGYRGRPARGRDGWDGRPSDPRSLGGVP